MDKCPVSLCVDSLFLASSSKMPPVDDQTELVISHGSQQRPPGGSQLHRVARSHGVKMWPLCPHSENVRGWRGQSRSGWELVGVTFSRVALDGPSLTPEGWPWTSSLLLGVSYLGVGQHGRSHPPRYPHQKPKANVYGGLWALQETPDSPTLFIVGSDLEKVK